MSTGFANRPAATPSQPDAFPPGASSPGGTLPYRQAQLPPAERTRDLLSRMTLEEKAAQMVGVWNGKAEMLVDAAGRFDPAKAAAAFKDGHGLGQVGRPSDAAGGIAPRATAELTNAIQKFFLENSRLGIPVVFHEECLHGQAAKESTSFCQPIGLAATFNPELVEQLYTMTAREARARGAHHALTPVVDVARDPRWGRVEETFGEDPYLVTRMGVAAVKGFQGDATFRDKTRVMATLKHFAAHGQPESGINCAPAEMSPRTLREVILPSFEAALKAGCVSVMASYNEIDGVPSHANRWLLRDLLRKEWGFTGFIVSDYYAIWELAHRPDTHGHHVALDKKAACALAVKAGVNIELPEPDCYRHLVELVHEGTLAESELDELVAPMLEWKFRLGLFDDPYVDPAVAERITGCAEHRALALQAARETITLLKNDGPLLPLKPAALKSIAVIGPNADRAMLGGYSGVPKQVVSVLEGVRAAVGDAVTVRYAEGCKITIGGSWAEDRVVASDPAQDRRQIAEAVEVAKASDAIVLCIGDNEQTSREGWGLKHLGDRSTLELVGRQDELAQALVATGKPVVVVLFSGRPIAINWISQNVPAILECWYLGQEGGTAIAEVLFGTFNPGGKLPISIPRSAGHLPSFYNYKPSARRGYLFDEVGPLYAFGFGLSYTTFDVAGVRLEKATVKQGETARVHAELKNTGSRQGTEVVQLYIRDDVGSVTRPVKELKGFTKVALKPGESRQVSFDITPDALAFWNVDMKRVVEPGTFTVMVGTSSRDEDLAKVTLTVAP